MDIPTLDEFVRLGKRISRLESQNKKLTAQVTELTKIVDALAPVVTDLLLASREAEREKVDGPPVAITVPDEEGGEWVTR